MILFNCVSLCLVLEDADGIVGKPIASKSNSFPADFVGLQIVLIADFVGSEDVGVGAVLCNSEGLLGPDSRVDDLSELLNLATVLLDHAISHIF